MLVHGRSVRSEKNSSHFKKTLDKPEEMCYTIITKGKEKEI
jgi:hypothetical protein